MDKRSALIAAARAAMIEQKGNVEIGDVARRAGVSVGLAYHHFGSKAGLVAAVVTEFYDRYDDIVMQDMGRGRPWLERERERLVRIVDFLFHDPLTPIILGQLSGSPEVAQIEFGRRGKIIESAAWVIERGQEKGELDPSLDPYVTAAIFTGGLREACNRWIARGDPPDAELFVSRSWRIMAAGLAPKN
ncbi:TetR/AcrR family transcriptional regulator [Pseudoruegeria sp. HB172150]|uniref:TetR/AcrR family transcriptional regulator n=1 Tax=Pseudoruegeria sp. HB172150 TaxID=2721164 RepID=UPI0015541F41|nr:TetR/AcrR family transcriptional regulator [Pseudoruegeria sp. HB172150]